MRYEGESLNEDQRAKADRIAEISQEVIQLSAQGSNEERVARLQRERYQIRLALAPLVIDRYGERIE